MLKWSFAFKLLLWIKYDYKFDFLRLYLQWNGTVEQKTEHKEYGVYFWFIDFEETSETDSKKINIYHSKKLYLCLDVNWALDNMHKLLLSILLLFYWLLHTIEIIKKVIKLKSICAIIVQ